MKKLAAVLLICVSGMLYAFTAQYGIPWVLTDNGMIMNQDIDLTSDTKWQSNVGVVSGMYGIHTHSFGVNACKVSGRTSDTVSIDDCTIHLDGYEYDFETSEFPNMTSVNVANLFTSYSTSSIFIGFTMNGYTTQDTFFTDTQINTVLAAARVQRTLAGGLSIMDERNIVSGVDKKDFRYRRGAIGPTISLDGGMAAESTGTRNIKLTEGSFYDEEGEEHILPEFALLSTIPLWRTTSSYDSWTTTGKAVFQLDNVYYNNVASGGLVAAQNNNKYIYEVIACSSSGGTINGVDTGRKPTCLSFYGPNEYDSLEAARNSPLDLGSFADSRPRLIVIAKVITNKNNSAIVDVWDERRFVTTPTGASIAITSTASLQTTYNNSPNGGTPEIITNDVNGAVTIRHGAAGVESKILELELDGGEDVFAVYTTYAEFTFSGITTARFDNTTATGLTRFFIYDSDNDTLERVSVGAADSGGAGYKVLRIPN